MANIQLSINSVDLLKKAVLLKNVVPGKPMLPVLRNFLFDIEPNELTMTASDLSTSVVTKMPIQASGSGKVAVPASILVETLRNIPEQPLSLSISTEHYNINLRAANGNYQIACENHIDFPQLPTIENSSGLLLNAKVFKRAIKQTLFASGKDDMYPNIQGVYIEIEPERTTFVATDGHRLVRYMIAQKTNSDKTKNVLIPRSSLQMLLQLLSENYEDMQCIIAEKHVHLLLGNEQISLTLVDGQFPNYHTVIPEKHPYQLTMQREQLEKATRVINLYASATTHEMRMHVQDKNVKIEAENSEFSNKGEIDLPCDYKGEPMVLNVHAGLLEELIKNMRHDCITIHLDNPERAIVITPEANTASEDLLMLIMPLQQYGA